jgi:hypothetical protein
MPTLAHLMLSPRVMRSILASLLLVGCVTSPPPETTSTAPAPLVGIDGSHDQADHGCHVVLRDLGRAGNGMGGYQTSGTSWIWAGTVEISTETAAAGLVPVVMYQYGSDPSWRQATAAPSAVTPTAGFARFNITLDQGLPGPDLSGSALATAKVQVVPYVQMAEGGRLFDHNRHPGDLDNYVIDGSKGFIVPSDGSTCAPALGPTQARVVFASDFTQTVTGVIVPGGELVVAYDPARLSGCAQTQGGYPQWGLTAHVRFAPGGQEFTPSVRDAAATVRVPADATSVALWFEATSVSGCHQWDSNFGNNYGYAVATAPAWLGNVGSVFTRDSSDPCAGAVGAGQGFNFETWTRQRAAITNLCFEAYQPGVTDHDDAAMGSRFDASLRWRADGGAWQVAAIGFDRRVGNNARFAWSWRAIDPFQSYHCPTGPTTLIQGGQYVQQQIEYEVVVNGAVAGPFTGYFADYAGDYWRSQNCH